MLFQLYLDSLYIFNAVHFLLLFFSVYIILVAFTCFYMVRIQERKRIRFYQRKSTIRSQLNAHHFLFVVFSFLLSQVPISVINYYVLEPEIWIKILNDIGWKIEKKQVNSFTTIIVGLLQNLIFSVCPVSCFLVGSFLKIWLCLRFCDCYHELLCSDSFPSSPKADMYLLLWLQ